MLRGGFGSDQSRTKHNRKHCVYCKQREKLTSLLLAGVNLNQSEYWSSHLSESKRYMHLRSLVPK